MHRLTRFTRTFLLVTVALMVGACPNTYADEVLYRYEGDVHPLDPSTGWGPANFCEPPCQQFVEDGHFVSRWENGTELFNYNLFIARLPEAPPPSALLGRVALSLESPVLGDFQLVRWRVQGSLR